MVRKVMVYGKQKTEKLAIAFEDLSVTSTTSNDLYINTSRPALTPITDNPRCGPSQERNVVLDGASHNETPKKIENVTGPHEPRMIARSNQDITKPATELKPSCEPQEKRTIVKKGRNLPLVDEGRGPVPRKKKGSATAKSKAKREAYNAQNEITNLTRLNAVDDGVKDINEVFKSWQETLLITKIAQGSFGSIFRTQMKSDPGSFTVCKLIPIAPKVGTECDGSLFTYIKDAAAEVKIMDRMTESPGFVQFRSAHVLKGRLPKLLLDMARKWDKEHPKDNTNSEDCKSELWLLIEMSDAGTDLATLLRQGFPDGTYLNKHKRHARLTLNQTWDIFWAVAEALAHGEMNAEFEHRDLHPGNICIKRKSKDSKTALDEEDFHLAPRYTDLEVTLIDYTLSRVTLEDSEKINNSMDDDDLFNGQGKNKVDRQQYNTYRHMRDIVKDHMGLPLKAKSDNLWSRYFPKTNLVWLHHILFVLLKETESWDQDHALAEILGCIQSKLNPVKIKDCVYNSATELVEAYMNGAYARWFAA